jgi:5S rRNA maturation endonuclease (ribonuclease M5)
VLRQVGLLNAIGNDAFTHRVVFPLEGNLYGRSVRNPSPHVFLPGSKGGLYAWEQVRLAPAVILVEGLFDYAVLWQAGFRNVTCSMGSHLNARRFQQLCDGLRTVYLAFDSDANQSGQQAAQQMSRRLWAQGVTARRVFCLMLRTRIASSSKVATPTSSSVSWRRLIRDLSSRSPARPRFRAKSISHCRAEKRM